MISGQFTLVHEAIISQLQIDPDLLCCSIRTAGSWNSFSRREFYKHVLAWSEIFSESLEPGSLILFLKRPDIHLLSAYIGAMCAGAIPAQMSYDRSKLREEEFAKKISHALESTQAHAVFHDTTSLLSSILPMGIKSFTPDSFKNSRNGPVSVKNQKALVQFSSGSTGLQKGVVLSHAAVLNQVRNYAGLLELNHQDRLITWLPLYHDMGLIACYLMPLIIGIPFYQIDPFEWIVQPDILLEAIEGFRGTICYLPNFAYHVLVRKGKDRDLSSMRMFVNCSEPAKRKTHEAFLLRFPSVKPEMLTVCYAMAENTFAVTQSLPLSTPVELTVKSDPELSCGRPITGTEICILDPNPVGEGEIGIKGDCLFDQFTDGTRQLENGFYRTGDLGYLRKDGSLVVTGRKKDLIIVNGKNVYPQDVEYVGSAVEGIYPGRIATFGVFDDLVGSEALYILAESDGRFPVPKLKAAIQKAVSDELGIVPKRVEILPHMELAKTSSGKISRSRNREMYLSGGIKLL